MDALTDRAIELAQAGKPEHALLLLNEALRIAPDHADAHFIRGGALALLSRHEEAIAEYDRTLALAPRHADALFNRAQAAVVLGRREAAIADLEAALALRPSDTSARTLLSRTLSDHAAALDAADQPYAALAVLDVALKHDPRNAEAHANRGLVLRYAGRLRESEAAFDRALALKPDLAMAGLGKAVTLMLAGDYARGFPLYEARRELLAGAARGEPAWDGGACDGLVRIWSKQGVGDQILLTRLLPLVMERTARVAVEFDQRLAPLLTRAFPDLETAAPAQAQCGAASLPALLGVTRETLSGAAFLKPEPARRDALRAKYGALAGGRPVVGLSWGSRDARFSNDKSASLSDWDDVLALPYLFVSLQIGDAKSEIAACGYGIHLDAEIDQKRHLDDFAAQIAAMDAVVTVSNTTAHLAGALGVRTLVLPPPGRGLFWYWGAEGMTTPWYDSVRVVRRMLEETRATQGARAALVLREMLS